MNIKMALLMVLLGFSTLLGACESADAPTDPGTTEAPAEAPADPGATEPPPAEEPAAP